MILFKGENNCIVVNAFSKKTYLAKNQNIIYLHIINSLIITPFGLSLPDRKLINIMGKLDAGEFLRTREEFYDEWWFS